MEDVLNKGFVKAYKAYIRVSKFAGIKAGRSVWRECSIMSEPYLTQEDAIKQLHFIVDRVLPATGVKIQYYTIESELVVNDEISIL